MPRRHHGNITKRPNADGTVAYRARCRGESRTFASELDAERWILDVTHSVRIEAPKVRQEGPTTSAWVERYVNRHARRWSYTTYETYDAIQQNHIEDSSIGDVPVDALTRDQVQAWTDGLDAKHKPNTVVFYLSLLRAAMAEAVRDGLRPDNPCMRIVVSSRPPSGTASWTRDEVRRVYDTVQDDARLDAFYRLMLSTGMRPGELRALRWSDIGAKSVTIWHTMSRERESATTKSKRIRIVPIPASVVATLDRWRGEGGEGLVIPAPELPSVPISATTLRAWHNAVIARAGVRPITLHGLRHTAATLMLAAGVPVKLVSDRLGHTSIAITLDTYVHPDLEMQTLAAERLDDWLSGATTSDENTAAIRNSDQEM